MLWMAHHQPSGVLPVEVTALAEDRLRALIVELRVVVKIGRAFALHALAPPARQCACLLAYVGLRIGASVGSQGEQLHQLASVILVRRRLRVLVPVQPLQHRRIGSDVVDEVAEGAECTPAEERVLIQHQALGPDTLVRGREPVVPDQGHPLDQRRDSSAPSGRATRDDRGPTRRRARLESACRRWVAAR